MRHSHTTCPGQARGHHKLPKTSCCSGESGIDSLSLSFDREIDIRKGEKRTQILAAQSGSVLIDLDTCDEEILEMRLLVSILQ